jgi:uncharacterized protein with HEPN domain
MPPEIDKTDRIRLMHMLDAARQALEFSASRNRASLDTDAMYRRAMISCIQEIGEAAVRVTEPTRQKVTELPWKQIVGMRHRLVHVYFDVNLDLVWEVVEKDLAPLVKCLEGVLESKS